MGEGEEIEDEFNNKNPRIELKREFECIVNQEADDFGASPKKKHVRLDYSYGNNDDLCSVVTEFASSFENSILDDDNGDGNDQNDNGNYGEITSESSGNSFSSGVSASQVTLEIPKDASTTGIRKITFKFSKSKVEYDSKPTMESPVFESSNEHGLDESSDRSLYNLELKMSKKVVPDGFPTNVKKLLATGILEGARVKYVSTSGEKEIPGEIRGCGYLCGCSLCSFTNVLSAYEFEQHCGGSKTRHPNNHIFLENGKPIYSIIEQLKMAPPGMLEEVVKDLAGSSFNADSFHAWKVSLHQSSGLVSKDKKHHREFHLSLTNGYLGVGIRGIRRKTDASAHVGKRSNSLFSPNLPKRKRRSDDGGKKRDNDLHRLLFMPNGLPEKAKLAYYVKGQKILEGYKQGNGIVCGHCDCEISPSQFEAHAGWAVRRQPYRHIYASNGSTLHDLAIELANGQAILTGNNDDMCTVCGDRGELVPCGACPRAFHQTCLGMQLVSGGTWHCPNCNDRKAESVSNSKPIIIRLTRVVKMPETDCGGCVLCRNNDFSIDKFDDRTVIICDQCEKEYHVGCLREDERCDLKELPKDKWFCCNDCDRIHVALRDLVLQGSELISSPDSNKISAKYIEKGLNEVIADDVHWRILSGKCRRTDDLPLLSRAVSIFRECFSPITAQTGRDLIPVMVHGRNISGQEFGGMHCVLLTVKSEVVSVGLLRILGREVAELPLVATSKDYQRKGYFLALFSRIEKLLSSLKVETLVLPAAEKAKSMWINRFGFRDMSPERLSVYTRDLQLTEFNGTIMLEKKVAAMTD